VGAGASSDASWGETGRLIRRCPHHGEGVRSMHTLEAMAATLMNVTAAKRTNVSIKRYLRSVLPNSTGGPSPRRVCLFGG
jgi:hypothetical protein